MYNGSPGGGHEWIQPALYQLTPGLFLICYLTDSAVVSHLESHTAFAGHEGVSSSANDD